MTTEHYGLRVIYPDEPAKVDLLRLDRLYSIISDDKRWRGYVTWDASPPANVSYHAHKFSILDAFQMGFAFLRTRFDDMWLIGGPFVMAVVFTLPQFVALTPVEPCGRFVYIEDIGTIRVYAYPDSVDCNEWWVGCFTECVKGRIVNGLMGYGT
jgi:hypothetical protein